MEDMIYDLGQQIWLGVDTLSLLTYYEISDYPIPGVCMYVFAR